MAKANCRICDIEFERFGRQYTCTDHKGMINKDCKGCGETFTSKQQHHVSYCETCRSKTRSCKYCKEDFAPQGNAKISEFCSDSCSHKWRWHNKYYTKKGYNQLGEDNNNWKDGKSQEYAIRIAKEAHGELCQRCGSDEGICVHHKDRNRQHNVIENLEVVCKRCHQIEHECWLSFLGVKGIPR